MPSMTNHWVRLVAVPMAMVLALALAGTAEAAGDAQRGRQIGYTCLGCHGIANYKNVYPTYSVPKLVGQHPEYIVAALKAYRGKQRSHATMYAQASSLSDQDMEDVAAYLADAVLPAGAPASGTAPQKVTELCSACHGANGIGITGDYPTLAGQHADYLARALVEYQKGDRKNPIMGSFAGQLSAAEVKAIADYYSVQRPPLQTVRRPNWL
ncbi:MAG: cytochrome c [Gammaproteobacteria bacterium]|nr:cytochrome c [Gammaproteobacteria bacterium]